MVDDFVTEFVMPAAPAAAATGFRRFQRGKIISGLVSFALFSVSLLLVLYAVNLLSQGVLMTYDPELPERHEEFKQLSGFDNVTTSGAGVDVCIVDTGIDMTHPDLKHIQLAGWNDFVQNRAEPYDDEGHGTAMAGILVAKNLLPGIAPDVNLYIAKAITSSGSGTDSVIASAVDWCTDNGVDIISLSLGGQQGINLIFLSTDELEDAVNRAINQGIYVVAAAGNDGGEDDDGLAQPADSPERRGRGRLTVVRHVARWGLETRGRGRYRLAGRWWRHGLIARERVRLRTRGWGRWLVAHPGEPRRRRQGCDSRVWSPYYGPRRCRHRPPWLRRRQRPPTSDRDGEPTAATISVSGASAGGSG